MSLALFCVLGALPASAISTTDRAREVEKYLQSHLRNRLLVLRAPIRGPSLIEFDGDGHPLGPWLAGNEMEHTALLFLKAVVEEGHVELVTERVRLSDVRPSRNGKQVVVKRGKEPVLSLLRVRFALDPAWLSSQDFRIPLRRLLLKVFLSEDEWRARSRGGTASSAPTIQRNFAQATPS